ncbi:Holliday junction resolvase RuvX [Mammaliicoccus vitulinus]|uniref:Holliday junction resolvase RuvX n=1 Tax=Mammaliicoccus vitulinus TaxID=71237 RepID=UPI00360E8AD5
MLKNRIIGLDVGSKTIGVAVSDAMGWTAQGIDTLRINEDKEEFGIDELIKIIDQYDVDTVIIGLPKNMNNSIGPRGEASIHFKEVLEQERPDLKMVMWDERLSTVGAERTLLEADVSRKKERKL